MVAGEVGADKMAEEARNCLNGDNRDANEYVVVAVAEGRLPVVR